MANNWFQFKQFLLRQEGAAMKVGTDSVILGAWVNVEKINTSLDVGTGTGILSLMLAQRMNGKIDAVEIDESAFREAVINVKNSPWALRINLFHDSFQNFSRTTSGKYDLIISNPPFFNHSYKAGSKQRTLARHADELPWKELIECSISLLSETGRLAVIIPNGEYEYFTRLTEAVGLKPLRLLRIFPKPYLPVKRIAVEYAFTGSTMTEEELTIESGGRHSYTNGYKELTGDFYL